MATNPVASARTVNEEFLRYQLTAFPIAGEKLARQWRKAFAGQGPDPRPSSRALSLPPQGAPDGADRP